MHYTYVQMQCFSPAFQKRFSHLLPPQIMITLPQGQTFIGSYSPPSNKIVGFRIFEKGDIIVLTYGGEGRFEAVLFDNKRVEKVFPTGTPPTGAPSTGINIISLIYYIPLSNFTVLYVFV